jgi:hypothetical protein
MPREVTYLIAALQGRACDVLHGVPRGATYEETIEALEDRFGDQHLAAAYRSQLKTRTQKPGESLQEFATAIEQPLLSNATMEATSVFFVARSPAITRTISCCELVSDVDSSSYELVFGPSSSLHRRVAELQANGSCNIGREATSEDTV